MSNSTSQTVFAVFDYLQPTITIDDVTVTEGNCGTKQAVFTVHLSSPSNGSVRVNYATVDGTATFADNDYVPISGTLVFPAGAVGGEISVTINGDVAFEGNETFTVQLGLTTLATLGDDSATGTITNDDTALGTGEEWVSWSRVSGVSACGSELVKPGSGGWDDAGASSTRQIAGSGYAQFSVVAESGYAMFGLSSDDSDLSYADVDYGIYTYAGGGTLWIYEKGVSRGPFGAYGVGDQLKIEVAAGVVTYYRNGDLLYTSTVPALQPLRVDTWLLSPGSTVVARLGGTLEEVPSLNREAVQWTNLVGVSLDGVALVKPTGRELERRGSFVHTSDRERGGGRGVQGSGGRRWLRDVRALFGRCRSDVWRHRLRVLHLPGQPDGVDLRKRDEPRAGGTYSIGDTLRVLVSGGIVRYLKNGEVVYTSAVTATYPMRVDTWLLSPDAAVEATIAGTLGNVSVATAEPVEWTRFVGTEAAGNVLSKPTDAFWNDAGASSTRQIAGGDGYAEFVVPPNGGGYAMFGLGNGDPSATYDDVEYAFYTYPDGNSLWIFEGGVSRGPVATYAAGDRLKVSVASGAVRYWRNDMLVYTSR